MNKIIIYIWIVLLTACASVKNEEAGYDTTQTDTLKEKAIFESQFTADNLTDGHFKAFEIRAIEKLNDFTDYLKIISDDAFNREFKLNAVSQARQLFVEYSLISLPDIAESTSVEAFLDQSYQSGEEIKVVFENPLVKMPLREATENLYEGTIAFEMTLLKNGSPIAVSPLERQADFYLMRTEKSFGTKKKMIWEVFLGDIY